MQNNIPVSYTHLEVYKRQPQNRAIPILQRRSCKTVVKCSGWANKIGKASSDVARKTATKAPPLIRL